MGENTNNNTVIEVNNLWKKYGEIVAVRNISFSVKKGEVLGFLGPNGAGKSTTMKILTCFIPSDEGSVNFSGLDIRENSLEVRKKIGYLPESAPLYLDMKVSEYLNFVADIRQIDRSIIKRRLDELVETCGLNGYTDRIIGQLSKGYRQRVGIAQTMLHDPDILIMDEPTVGLDPNQIVEIRQLIKEIGKKKTVILSTHILPEVEATCDRVIIINNGSLVANGTTDELIGKSRGSNEKIICKIRGNSTEIETKLKEIKSIERVFKKQEEINELTYFEISPKDSNDPSEEIFFTVAKNGWSLTELKREGKSLEDVFAQLTQGEV